MKTKDLSIGTPWKVLILFAIPMILSVTLQQIYNIADSAIAGNLISSDALASVSASYPITMIYLSIATGLGIGSGVITSKFFGSKDIKNTKSAIYTSLILALMLALFMTLIGIIITNLSLRLIETPDNIFSDASLYLKFYCGGLVFTYLYNVITCIFQSLGNSKTPLYFLIFSTILNIGLDLLFVGVFDLKVLGLALGTFIAQGVAMILSLIFLLINIKKVLPTEEKVHFFSSNIMNQIMVIAIPSIIQGATISLGNFFIQRNINSFGSDVIAGYGASYKLVYIVVNIFTAYGNAISNYTSQNIGANKYSRIVKGFKVALLISLSFAVITSIILVIFPTEFLKIFMDGDEGIEAINVGKVFIYIVAPFLFVSGTKLTFDGVLKGSKDMLSFMISTFTDLILRIIFSFILSKPFGYQGIFMAWPIGWILGTSISVIMFFVGRWKKLAFPNGIKIENN